MRAPQGRGVHERRNRTHRDHQAIPGVVANDDVNLTVEKGEIHAICGENGAGKSTLMKILYGMQPADEGVMKVNGKVVDSPPRPTPSTTASAWCTSTSCSPTN